MRRPQRLVLLALACALSGCPASEHVLAVDLRTDYNPRAEIDQITLTLDGERVAEMPADPATDYVDGVRVLERAGVLAGLHRVVVELREEGALVASRPIAVEVSSDQVVTALITRSCRDIDCPETCEAGQCVSEDCTPQTPQRCPPEPQCRAAGECTDGAACSVGRCTDGACLYEEVPMACGADAYCDPDSGCQPLVPPTCTLCPDPTFGAAGIVALDFGGLPAPYTDTGTIVARDGRIYVIARAGNPNDSDYAVARLEPTGALDPTFGVAGVATFDVDTEDRTHGLFEAANGDLIVCGESNDVGVVARLDVSGALVSSFGTAGVTLIDLAPNKDLVNGCAEMLDQSIVASGQAFFDLPNAADLQTVGLTAAGAPNLAFASGGSVAEHVGVGDEFGSMRRDPRDRILAYGSSFQAAPASHDCLILRYTPDGARDPGFGVGGLVLVDFEQQANRCSGVRTAGRGGLVSGGVLELPGGDSDVLVYRFTAGGGLDAAFGVGGIARVDLGCADSSRAAIELADGRVAAVATGCPTGGAPTGALLMLGADGTLLDTLVMEGTSSATGLSIDAGGRLLVYGAEGPPGATLIRVTRVLP